jgi:NtrC-family two-component system sensor histidine kinase KinB
LLVLRDVTRLKELDRLKTEFVATASHELRTPLTGIGMSLALLRENLAPQLDETQRDLLEVADEEVARLKGLVEELLDLSKIEAGRIDLSFSAVPLADLFARVEKAFSTQLHERDIKMTVTLAENVPEVRVDRNKIAWVLANLIGNALRYVASGGRIQLSASRGGQLVEVAVQDDGAGIPLEHQARIFDKFVSINTGGGNRPGTGLGLAICREIVRAHGGAIWVESKPGDGATFRFTVPIATT